MLTAGTAVQGSGCYVAVELVSGKLHGRSGSFILQHSGTMTRGAPKLMISVVPDSGTGELAGLAGTMMINITADEGVLILETASGVEPAPILGTESQAA